MLRHLRSIAVFVACVLLTPARAQIPPHQPGTICFTPTFWCWALQIGPPGAPCQCPSPYGPIWGRLG